MKHPNISLQPYHEIYIYIYHITCRSTIYKLYGTWEETTNTVHRTFNVCPETYTIIDTSDLVKRYVNEPHDAMKLVPLGVF